LRRRTTSSSRDGSIGWVAPFAQPIPAPGTAVFRRVASARSPSGAARSTLSRETSAASFLAPFGWRSVTRGPHLWRPMSPDGATARAPLSRSLSCIPVFRRGYTDVSVAPESPSSPHGLGATAPAIQNAFHRIDSRPFRSSERLREDLFIVPLESLDTLVARSDSSLLVENGMPRASLPSVRLVRLSALLDVRRQSVSHRLLQPTRCLSTLRVVRLPERAFAVAACAASS